MSWKEFFKPTRGKVIIMIILGIILVFLFDYSTLNYHNPFKNLFLEKIGMVVNIVPLIFLLLVGKGMNAGIFPFPIDFFLVIIAYYIVPFLWAYFLSCLIYWIIGKLKSKSKRK